VFKQWSKRVIFFTYHTTNTSSVVTTWQLDNCISVDVICIVLPLLNDNYNSIKQKMPDVKQIIRTNMNGRL